MQDSIFRKMSANRKLKIASLLWRLGKNLDYEKTSYTRHRSDSSFGKYR